MHVNVAELYPNPETSAKVLNYSISKSTPLPDWLLKYHEWACHNTEVPQFLISTYEAQALVFLARLVARNEVCPTTGKFEPRAEQQPLPIRFLLADYCTFTVLEVGVYIGFSAMVWSHGVGKDGDVVGLELSEEYAGIADKAFKDHGIEHVDIKLGDVVESLASLEPSEPFDVIFLDANKDAYPKYLELILSNSQPGSPSRLLKAGGLIVADNVLQRATVADATPSNPRYVEDLERLGERRFRELNKALHQFNDKLVADPRLEAFLLPMFDGLGLARLVD